MPQDNTISEGASSYEDDKLKFYLSAYTPANQHNENRRDKVVENRTFFDGYDEVLVKRAQNPNIARASHFVHEARPAIDTRANIISDRLSDSDTPVLLTTKPEFQNDEKINDLNMQKTLEINKYLRESGYLVQTQRDHFMGAEIQPVSWVKISKDSLIQDTPVEKQIDVTVESTIGYILRHKRLPPGFTTREDGTAYIRQVKWEEKPIYDGPVIEWADWDEILYDPTAPSFDKMRFIIHRSWMTWNELYQFTKDINGNIKELENAKDDVNAENNEEQLKISDEIKSEEGDETIDPLISGKKEDKYLICEFWFKHYNTKTERREIRVMYVVRNAVIIKDRLSPFRGFDFPFYPKVAHRRLGDFEGDSSIDLVKDIQRIYNDLYNALLDFLSYGGLKEMWLHESITFKEQPKRGPGAIVYYQGDPSGIVPNTVDVMVVQYIVQLINMAAIKIRHILNAPDISQGMMDAGGEEKATKTRLRQQGHLRRFRNVFLDTEDDIKEITKMCMMILVQDDPDWITPIQTAEIKVPSLSGTLTTEEEQLFAAELYKMAEDSLVYQGPVGMKYLLELFRDVLEKSKVKNINDRIPTEEELTKQNQVLQLIESMMAEEEGGENAS